MRVLQQHPHECLFSFIASSNNYITRITSMLHSLRTEYGTPLGHGVYAFPTLHQMQPIEEARYRELGFGYRAKFFVRTTKMLLALPPTHLSMLRGQPADVVQKELTNFFGVGKKIADCVALFSLDIHGAIPIDTHVWQIAKRDYDPLGLLKDYEKVTPKLYPLVVGLFSSRFGEYTGWAHSLLFMAELPAFKEKVEKRNGSSTLIKKKNKGGMSPIKKKMKLKAQEKNNGMITPIKKRKEESSTPILRKNTARVLENTPSLTKRAKADLSTPKRKLELERYMRELSKE